MNERAGVGGLPRRSETILLVDDEQIVREITREILELEDYHVLEAARGEEAIEVCRGYGGPVDLVMTDVSMPQMGGRELVEKLRPLVPKAKVLYMSGYTDDAIGHPGGVDQERYFLEKPFDSGKLLTKVREVLNVGARRGRA